MTVQILTIFIAIIILVIAWLAFMMVLESLRGKAKVVTSLNTMLFRVRLPKDDPRGTADDRRSDKERIGIMEQFLGSFAALHWGGWKGMVYGEPHIAFEMAVHHVGEEIHFYVAAPAMHADLVQRTVHGFYPTASVERVHDYNIFVPHGAHAASTLGLSKKHFLPLRTYAMLEADPLSNISNALSKLEREGEGAAVQVVLQHTDGSWAKAALKVAKFMQEGKTYEAAAAQAGGGFGALAHDLVSGGAQKKKEKSDEDRARTMLTPLAQETIKAIEQKASKAGFHVNVRLVASAADAARAAHILEQLENAFTQFNHPSWNSFKVRRFKGRGLRELLYDFSFRLYDTASSMLLNTEEIASLFHFPLASTVTPRIAWLKSKAAPPPEDLPAASEGSHVELGESVFRGERASVRLLREDRRRHLYIIGQTGTGKSTMLAEMIRQDIANGEGVGVIDPHGDLAEMVAGLVPRERAQDVVYFDPGDMARPIGLNMLEAHTEEQRDFAVQEMIAIFMKLFPPEVIGPMFEHNMRNAMLTLMADPENPGTIVEIPRIFTDEAYMRSLLPKVADPIVRAFWEKEMAKTTEFHKSEMLGYLISKVGRFVENEMMRNIIGQPRSGFNMRDIMDKRKILIANLSKGKMGEVNSALLGMIMVSKLQMAAMGRTTTPQEGRSDFYLYIDEFQNFTTDSIATILSEARKYRLNLIMAHQFIAQLPDPIKNAAFGNVGSVCALRVSADDGEYLARQFEPVFSQHDLVNLDNFNAVTKLMIRGQTSRPFNMQITKSWERGTQPAASVGETIKEMSRLAFGRPREIVQREILERSQLARPAAAPAMVAGESNK
ncbi:MAG: type IV secretion system DNA-binding domain-containing protein [bacterium]|nr:type IV secretion system DNA-binding domain-containing protein [bacterium]